ncbi:MAG: hypothetical protein QF437_18605, partial [Planctomycetota bacterium]|nr:hypothetical protein [Planctomycetota bacterium]
MLQARTRAKSDRNGFQMRILGTDEIMMGSARIRPVVPAKPVQSGETPLPADVGAYIIDPETAALFGEPTDFFNKPIGVTDLKVRVSPPPVIIEPPEPPATRSSIKEKLSIMLESLNVAKNAATAGMADSLTQERRMELLVVGQFFVGRASATIETIDMDRLFEILGDLSNDSREGISEGLSMLGEFSFDISNRVKASVSFDALNRILSFLKPIEECLRPPSKKPVPVP